MILLLSACSGGAALAQAVSVSCSEPTEIVHDFRSAITRLEANQPRVLVIDQAMLELSNDRLVLLLKRAGSSLQVCINFALHQKEDVTDEISCAVRRVGLEYETALQELQSELNTIFSSDLGEIGRMAAKLAGTQLNDRSEAKLRRILRAVENLKSSLARPAQAAGERLAS